MLTILQLLPLADSAIVRRSAPRPARVSIPGSAHRADRHIAAWGLALALTLIVGVCNSYAADLTWTNASSGAWQSRTAWITNGTGGSGGYPGATDAAWFTNAATYSVTITNDVTVLSNFFSNASNTTATVTLDLGTNSFSAIGSGTHPGSFVLGDTADSTTIVYLAASSVAGKGLFVTNSTAGRICVGSYGVGTLFVTNGSVVAGRTIVANQDTASGTLVLSGSSTIWSNTGSLTIGNTATATGSSMVISNSASMTVLNTFGVGTSGSGGHSLLLDTGGRLFTGNAGTVTVGSGAGTNNSATVQNGARWDNGGALLSVGGTGTGNSLTIGTTATVTSVSTLSIASGNFLNMSGGVLNVSVAVNNAAGMIKGFGTIVGNTTFTGTGTLTPGYSSSIGTLTCSNAITLSSTSITIMKLDKSQSSNDLVNAVGAMTYGGTLTVTNVGSVLAGGDTFNLFNFSSQSGSFTVTNLPSLTTGMSWDTSKLNSQGILTVSGPPLASFTASPTNGEAPLAVTFTDISAGAITNRFWSFGDGGTSNTTLTSLSYSYGTAGTYNVSLTVSGSGGTNTSTRTSYIVVTNPPPPVAVFTGSPTSGTAPLLVTFTDSSTGNITNRFWNFGDGNTTNTSATTMSHTYAAGTYNVSLTVSGLGGTNTQTQVSYITALTPGSISVSPASYNFGSVTTGTTAQTTFVVTNSGGTAVSNGTATVTGGPYTILSGATYSVPGLGATNVVVQFAPVTVGGFSNNVIFATANGGNSTNIVIGTGVAPGNFTGAQQLRPVSLGWVDPACQLALTYDDGGSPDYSPLRLSVTNFGSGVSFVGGHVNFSGSGSRREEIVSARTLANSFTIAIWVRYEGNVNLGPILEDTTGAYGLYVSSPGLHYDYYIGGDNTSTATVLSNTWTFVAVVVTNYAGQSAVQFWINGAKDALYTNVTRQSWIPGHIGADVSSESWIGDFDDVFVFGRALSDVEIPQLYQATINDPR